MILLEPILAVVLIKYLNFHGFGDLGYNKLKGLKDHVRFKHTDGRRTVIPVHGNEKLGKGLILEILKQIKLSKEEFEKII